MTEDTFPEELLEEEPLEEGELLEALPPEDHDTVRWYLTEMGKHPLLTLEEEVDLARRIWQGQEAARTLAGLHSLEEASVLAAARARLLEREPSPALMPLLKTSPEEVEAAVRASREGRRLYVLVREGEAARQTMVMANLRLVVNVAKRHTRAMKGMEFLDLIQEGNLGLFRATFTFDYRRRLKFSTYATWWIQQGIQRALHSQNRLVRLPVHLEEEISRLYRAERELLGELGRPPTPEELAARLGREEKRLEELREWALHVHSLDHPVRKEDGEEDPEASLLHFLAKDGEGPEERAEREILRLKVERALESLTEREALVVRLRQGMADGRRWTLEEVASRVGVTRERVRQIEGRAMRKLAELLREVRDYLKE